MVVVVEVGFMGGKGKRKEVLSFSFSEEMGIKGD